MSTYQNVCDSTHNLRFLNTNAMYMYDKIICAKAVLPAKKNVIKLL